MVAQRRYSHPVDGSTGVVFDQTLVLRGYQSAKDYPASFRGIRYQRWDRPDSGSQSEKDNNKDTDNCDGSNGAVVSEGKPDRNDGDCTEHQPAGQRTGSEFKPRPGESPAVARWRQRMATPQAREIYQDRTANAECVNAQVRNRGLQRMPVRGLLKAKAVALLHALAHNLTRMIALAPALVGRSDMRAAPTVCRAQKSNSSRVQAGLRTLRRRHRPGERRTSLPIDPASDCLHESERSKCSQALSLNTVEARLLHLIRTEGDTAGLATGSGLKSLAREIGVTHEALYRCVAGLERRGLLTRAENRLCLRGAVGETPRGVAASQPPDDDHASRGRLKP